jgi:hypothetical protein
MTGADRSLTCGHARNTVKFALGTNGDGCHRVSGPSHRFTRSGRAPKGKRDRQEVVRKTTEKHKRKQQKHEKEDDEMERVGRSSP